MVDNCLGLRYQLHSSNNLDEYLKAAGVGFALRKLAKFVKPIIELTKNENEYTLRTFSAFKNTVTKFVNGLETQVASPIDGRILKATFTISGNTINEVHIAESGKTSYITRVWSENEVKMRLELNDVVCTRVYRRLK